tara:strand:+ start:3076 stop:3579 length:504 start_codon:yes stop_codon:yes gene_type:complete
VNIVTQDTHLLGIKTTTDNFKILKGIISVILLYGLKSCDSCRQSMRWLAAEEANTKFHDLRIDGLQTSTLDNWIKIVGWKNLLNKSSATWRVLPTSVTRNLSEKTARDLMLGHRALIKRPVFEFSARVLVGFKVEQKTELKNFIDGQEERRLIESERAEKCDINNNC